MSEKEKDRGGSNAGGSLVVMEKTDKCQKSPFRTNELQVETDVHHIRSTAPTVPSVIDKLKNASEESSKDEEGKIKKLINAMSSDIQKTTEAKKLSTDLKRRDISPETIPMAAIGTDSKKVAKPAAPIPAEMKASESATSRDSASVKEVIKDDEDSIAEEVSDLRTAELEKKHSEWSDDEEAGGLPRSESRASRVSRVVRQFFCCGVSYENPSQENISPRHYSHAI